MTMSEPLSTGGEALFDLPLTSSPEGSRASRSRLPAAGVGSRTSGGVGRGWQRWSAHYDLATSSWRTSGTLFETPTRSGGCSVTFTSSGSMRSGRLSPRVPWVPHTDDAGLFVVAYPRGEGLPGLHEARGRIDLQPAAGDVRGSWAPEPAVARVADGVPRRLVRHDIHALGNAVVPAVGEFVGRLVMGAAA
jgi:hypothetical protein